VLEAFAVHPEVSLDALRWLLQGANDAVAAKQVAGTLTADMRTTIVVLLLDLYSGAALWAHAGDSRLYHWHDARLLGRTRDQSLEQRLHDAGLRAPAAASGELTSALGSPDGFEFEILETPQMLASGDALLLCSDGLWSAFDDVEMARSVIGCSGVQAWLGRLEAGVQRAGRSDQDNYSALAIWCGAG
jgi:PPM family protein phosphatase